MLIARNFIDDLINRADIVEIIESYMTLRKTGKNFTACCPFHQEKTASFTINPDKQFYYCFGCHAHGNALTFIMEYAHLDYVEAIHELASRLGIQVVYEQGNAPTALEQHDDLYQLISEVARYYQQQLRYAEIAKNYLKNRGLTGEIAKEFELGYAPAGWDNLFKFFGSETQELLIKAGLLSESDKKQRYDRFRHRIMFPIRDQRGRIIAFGGRVLDDSKPKYLNSPETILFQKSKTLYGWHRVKKSQPDKVIIVEGYLDVIALAQYGIHNAVATLGTAITKEHLTLLFRHVSEIIFCFDGDTAGYKAAERVLKSVILPLLREGRLVNFVFLPQNNDPDTLIRQIGRESFDRYLEKTVPLSKFLFDSLLQQVNLTHLEGKAHLIELAKPLLEQLPPQSSHATLFWNVLTDLTGVPLEKLKTTNKLVSTNQSIKSNNRAIYSKPPINTLIQKIIRNLLHKPKLSQLVINPKELINVNLPDINLLIELLELSNRNPQLTLAGIYEHWYHTQHSDVINKLIQQEMLLTYDETDLNVETEFVEAINYLKDYYKMQRIELLRQKGTFSQLSAQDVQELNTLLLSK